MDRDLSGSMCTDAELTQVPVRNSVIIIQFIILIFIFLNPITLMLLGNCARPVEAWSDVLLVVRNCLIFLNVALMANVRDERDVCCGDISFNMAEPWMDYNSTLHVCLKNNHNHLGSSVSIKSDYPWRSRL